MKISDIEFNLIPIQFSIDQIPFDPDCKEKVYDFGT